jgi:hypothetical protein
MVNVKTAEEIQRLLDDRPERTQTYRVEANLVSRVSDSRAELRTMDDAETSELADYLEVAVENLKGPLRVVDARCTHCQRRITFLDFVQTAVRSGHHDRAELRAVLTGKAGAWITIRGRDGGRAVTCFRCGQLARTPSEYSEYSNPNYAYA